MSPFTHCFGRVAVGLAAFAASLAAAQSPEPNDDSIDEILVVAEREPGNLFLSGDDFSRLQASSLEDLFANESTIAVGGGSVTAQKIYVRGFEDVMLNVTIDGAQSPGELYHHQARVQLEPEFLKTIELDAGAGAATNGAGALTGALKATLKDASDMLRPGQEFGAFFKAAGRFNGEDGQKYTASAYGNLSDTIGAVIGYTYEDRGNYEDGNGDVPGPSSFEHGRGFLKLNADVGSHEYSFTYENVQDEALTFERPNLINFTGTYETSDQEMNRDTAAFNYDYAPGGDLVNVSTTVYYNNTDFVVQRRNASIIYGEGDFASVGFDLRNTSIFGDHALTYGIDYREDEVESAQNAAPPFTWDTSEQTASVIGLFVQDNWRVTDTFDVSFGLRFDDYDFDAEAGVSAGVGMSSSQASPNLSFQWELVGGFTARAGYAQAFRGVTIREAFFSALYVHDGTLEPEEADNLEFGLAWERDGWFARGTVYKQTIEDFIDTEFTGPFPVWGYWRNTGDAEVEGYEFEAGLQRDNYYLKLGVWDADNELNGEPIDDGNLGLGTNIGRTWLGTFQYELNEANADLRLDARYVEAEENSIAPGAPAKGSYLVANLYANWRPTEQLTLSLAATNLLDKFYYDHATYTWIGGNFNTYVGYPGKGRELTASVAYRF